VSPVIVEVKGWMRGLVPGFLGHRRDDVARLRTAASCGDFATARTIGHNLKGLGTSYGFPPVSEIGLFVEHAADIGDLVGVREAADQLSEFLGAVHVIYR
jgi:hypothetical protein